MSFGSPCGAPLLARYDLAAARAWDRDSLRGREAFRENYRGATKPGPSAARSRDASRRPEVPTP